MGQATVPNIEYPKNGMMKTGDLAINILDGRVSHVEGDAYLKGIAGLAGDIASRSSVEMCFNSTKFQRREAEAEAMMPPGGVLGWKGLGPGSGYTDEQMLLCNMAGLMLIEFYSGSSTNGPDARLLISLEFEKHSGDGADMTQEICENVMLGVDVGATLISFVPFIGPLLAVGLKACSMACKLADKVMEAEDTVNSVLSGIAEASSAGSNVTGNWAVATSAEASVLSAA